MEILLTKDDAEILSALIDRGFEEGLWHPIFDKGVKKIQSKLESNHQSLTHPQYDIPGLSMMG
jgi:hypothetical protein